MRHVVAFLLSVLPFAYAQWWTTNTPASWTPTSTVAAARSTPTPQGQCAVFGLTTDGRQRNGIYFGVLNDWLRESPKDVNRALGAPVALIGDYAGVQLEDPSFGQLEWHFDDVVAMKDTAVYVPAILPWFSLRNWTQAMSDDLAGHLAMYNKAGVTVWLRFAYEMNGYWMRYGLDPDAYVSTFRSVINTIRANKDCTATYTLWAPNVMSGDITQQHGYTPYYPGDDYVDLVGLSYYHSGPNKTDNVIPANNTFADGIASFYAEYGSRKPMVIAETSAQYHYELPDDHKFVGGDSELTGILPHGGVLKSVPRDSPSEIDMKRAWAEQMTSAATAARFPNLTAVCWFSYFKASDSEDQILDYRMVGGNVEVTQFFRSFIGNETAWQQGYSGLANTIPSSHIMLLCLTLLTSVTLL